MSKKKDLSKEQVQLEIENPSTNLPEGTNRVPGEQKEIDNKGDERDGKK